MSQKSNLGNYSFKENDSQNTLSPFFVRLLIFLCCPRYVCVGKKKSTHSLLCDAWVGLWFGFYKSTEMLAQNEKRLINDNMSHFENNKSKQICKNSHSPRYEPFVVSWFRVTKFSFQVFCCCLFVRFHFPFSRFIKRSHSWFYRHWAWFS